MGAVWVVGVEGGITGATVATGVGAGAGAAVLVVGVLGLDGAPDTGWFILASRAANESARVLLAAVWAAVWSASDLAWAARASDWALAWAVIASAWALAWAAIWA